MEDKTHDVMRHGGCFFTVAVHYIRTTSTECDMAFFEGGLLPTMCRKDEEIRGLPFNGEAFVNVKYGHELIIGSHPKRDWRRWSPPRRASS